MAGDVIELGDGSTGAKKHEFQLKVGDTIIYSKFGIGVTDVQFQDAEHALLKEDDVIGILPRSGATAADLPEIRPLGDRVLLKVELPPAESFAKNLLIKWANASARLQRSLHSDLSDCCCGLVSHCTSFLSGMMGTCIILS